MTETEAKLVAMLHRLCHALGDDSGLKEHAREVAGDIQREIQNTFDESVRGGSR